MNWDNLDKLSDLLQVLNFALLLQDNTNNDLMKELQKQDNILNEQTEVYLKEINKKLDIMLEKLERRKDGL
jgi:Mg2+ and Co2+ transporter CorA